MTVILASLAMDLAWTPPSQENERIPPVLFAVCFFYSLVPTMRYWEEKKKKRRVLGGRERCKYPLFALPC